MLQTPLFLREHGLLALQEKFSIIANRHETFPQLLSLKYNQLLSPMDERIAQECRGLIVDE